jgi:hypothetical protein
VTTYEAAVGRVALFASVLLPWLRALVVAGVLAAVAAGIGAAASDSWQASGLVAGFVLVIAFCAPPFVLARFAADVGKVRDLPEVRTADLQEAARQLRGRLAEGERRFAEASGLARLWHLWSALRSLRADIDDLAAGGLGPAVALGRALRPARLLWVSLAALATPLLVIAGALALAAGLLIF